MKLMMRKEICLLNRIEHELFSLRAIIVFFERGHDNYSPTRNIYEHCLFASFSVAQWWCWLRYYYFKLIVASPRTYQYLVLDQIHHKIIKLTWSLYNLSLSTFSFLLSCFSIFWRNILLKKKTTQIVLIELQHIETSCFEPS